MPIRELPRLLVNQIAAGEVIERPASVVKELIENSLDAGARRIDVVVEDGGRRLVRVSDDGAGIVRAELALAAFPHATSKLAAPEDLAAIGTLGFRGEALASIASVSRMCLTSRATVDGAVAESGHRIEAEGDHLGEPAPTATAPGTVVTVRDLFFNTPARRKFLRTTGTEFGHVADVVSRTAMAWPEVAFTLTHDGRGHLAVAATADRRQRCLDVLGGDLEEALLEVASAAPDAAGRPDGGLRVWGLAGLPSIARRSGRSQYLYLNRRPVRDRNMAHALREAYRGLMAHDLQPVAVVMLQLDATAMDVNVHPAKAEVRFRDPSRVHGLVLTAFRERLLGSDLTPKLSLTGPVDGDDTTGRAVGDAAPMPTPVPGERPARPGHDSGGGLAAYFDGQPDARQPGFRLDEVRDALEADAGAGRSGDGAYPPGAGMPRILQVHKSYLVTECDDGLLIVDQHALHERVMFEQLLERLRQRDLESQRLLMPATFSADPGAMSRLESLQPLLRRIGVEAGPMGPGRIGIHAFATFLFDRKVDPVEFLSELLDRAESGQLVPEGVEAGPQTEEAALHRVLDMMACKAAVKAGDQLGPAELADLLARREQVERSGSCPHGRPTTLRLSLGDLARQFKRTGGGR